MSQSSTLYIVTQETFKEIEKANGKKISPSKLTNTFFTFQGSSMALEFLLSKGRDESTKKLIEEIFNPQSCIGISDVSMMDFNSIEEEELWNLLDGVVYISPEKGQLISSILDSIIEEEISNNYNSDELNNGGIYPEIWHDDNSEDQAFNQKHILEDFKELKSLLKKAAENQDYILVY
jgi:hypothetical protein